MERPADHVVWLTVSEAARLINVSPFQVSRWANRSDLETNGKTGRLRRVTLASAREQARRLGPRRNHRGSDRDRIVVGPPNGDGDGTGHAQLSIGPPPGLPVAPDAGRDPNGLVDRRTFTVRCDGKTCVLRNTKEFSFFSALARQPGVYIAVDLLVHEVWDGNKRSGSAIKTVASNLRKALKEAGIDRICIDGTTNRRHYALIIG